jgi:hypothetical protein
VGLDILISMDHMLGDCCLELTQNNGEERKVGI